MNFVFGRQRFDDTHLTAVFNCSLYLQRHTPRHCYLAKLFISFKLRCLVYVSLVLRPDLLLLAPMFRYFRYVTLPPSATSWSFCSGSNTDIYETKRMPILYMNSIWRLVSLGIAPMLQSDKFSDWSMRSQSFLIKTPPSARGASRCHGDVVRVLASSPSFFFLFFHRTYSDCRL
jgi:hypothetical protein